MNLANRLTVSRIFLSPFFLIFFILSSEIKEFSFVFIVILIFIFLLIELSDLLDGIIARSFNLVSDIGKLLDPFADVVSRITYFVCFLISGIMPVWLFIIFLYREIAISFIRLLMLQTGVTLGARNSGKLKAVFYTISGFAGLFFYSIKKFDLLKEYHSIVSLLVLGVFFVAAILSVLSFVDYLIVLQKKRAGKA